MGQFLLRAIGPALKVSIPLTVILMAVGWHWEIISSLTFLSLLAYHWFFMEVDLTNIKNIKENGVYVCVIGSGLSGICSGIKLKAARIPFVILEKSSSFGGTWWDNKYPGCAVDIKSSLYQYSFFMNPNWANQFGERKELYGYITKAVAHFGLEKNIRLNTKVLKAEWLPNDKKWKISYESPEGKYSLMCTHVMSCCGPLRERNYPKIPGMDKFKGKQFHSQDWDESYDYTNKRVAIIGSAASAVQIAPAIVDKVKSLHVFQRTPNWHFPRHQIHWPEWFKKILTSFWIVGKLMRLQVFLGNESAHLFFFKEKETLFTMLQKRFMTKFIKDQLNGNEELIKSAVPDYTIGCKRILVVNDFWPIFVKKPNATLVTESPKEINEAGILTKSGQQIDADLIVYATGFKVFESVCGFETVGRNGANMLHKLQEQGGSAYYGVSVDEFPNFFVVVGANTGLVHNSIIFMIECVVNHIMTILRQVVEENIETVEVKKEVLKKFENDIDRWSANRTYASNSCASWYKHSSGLNRGVWPLSLPSFWLKTRNVDLKRDFNLTYK